jgi:hypothetical protein
MYWFSYKLTSAPDMAVGEALRWAKSRYMGEVPSGGFNEYDEKVMIEATLYGLPMYAVSVPTPTMSSDMDVPVIRASAQATESLSLSPGFSLVTDSPDGDYYTSDSGVQASGGRPIQPRTSVTVSIRNGQTPHGAILVGATSNSEYIDPLVARPVTDTTLSEPLYDAEIWLPAKMWTVNRLGDEPRLVVVPAQFLGDQDWGILRRFTSLQFEVYYTDTQEADFIPPTIWEVEGVILQGGTQFVVDAEDNSGIQRVVMVYTEDGDRWDNHDLSQDPADGLWKITLTDLSDTFLYFIQVVDGAGNVSLSTNKGYLFEPPKNRIYLPMVFRGYRPSAVE